MDGVHRIHYESRIITIALPSDMYFNRTTLIITCFASLITHARTPCETTESIFRYTALLIDKILEQPIMIPRTKFIHGVSGGIV